MVIRDLSVEETDNLRKQLDQRIISTMGTRNSYWYPLFPVYKNVPVIAFDSDFVAIAENINKIRDIFIQHNVSYVIEIQELKNARIIEGFTDEEYFLEEDEDSIILPYMSECFWYDNNNDWIMYVSHEGTVAFEGEWLINGIKEKIENYREYEIKNFKNKY
jgi:hypothetical protein